jgi:flagellar protein FliJ
MKAFVFSLQRLLDAKEVFERMAEEKLSASLRVLANEKEKLMKLSAQARGQIGKIESFRGIMTHRHKLSVHLRYLERVQRRIVAQVEAVTRQETVVEELRNQLCIMIRERKSVEKLRDRERNLWLQELKKSEQKEMDEHAAIGFLNQRMEAMAAAMYKKGSAGHS